MKMKNPDNNPDRVSGFQFQNEVICVIPTEPHQECRDSADQERGFGLSRQLSRQNGGIMLKLGLFSTNHDINETFGCLSDPATLAAPKSLRPLGKLRRKRGGVAEALQFKKPRFRAKEI